MDELDPSSRYDATIFDLGDVLVHWEPSTEGVPIPPLTFKHMCRSITWFEYEKGHLTTEEAFRKMAGTYGYSYEQVVQTFDAAKSSIKIDTSLFDLIREIKLSGRRVFAMSNISRPDCELVAARVESKYWSLFDRVFTS